MNGTAAEFEWTFGYPAESVWSAPGRINLIGEHTDYNDGFVLPMALDHSLAVAAARRDDGTVRLRSRQEPGATDVAVDELEPGSVTGWAGYPAGAIWALLRCGHRVGGLDLLVDSTIPTGAGLSSSAALTCATALATLHLYGIDTDRRSIARAAQHAEGEFVGMPCGILDQSAVLLAERGHALFMDTRSLQTEQVPVDLAEHGLALLTIDTRAPHRLVGGEYAERRRCCEQAARTLGVPALREIDAARLPETLDALDDDRTRRRVRHVVTENERVLRTVELLRAGKLRDVGPLLTASHVSLRDDYEVSVAEVDTAVDAALEAGALGARITGGGFGGCVIALVDEHRASACTEAVRAAYHRNGFTPPETFTVTPAAGARREA
ncbi:galactokinase [Lipingzhangella halophila]|uniref:Galactokinase n=1 Tax=Lipingzhangella halophila TaxID=1783352 RepID=A0A7W7W2S7_9ACTN|nr:galactokinase [Lipingzhangella halophila]MBB4931094.1 galactokinase [Lipingzhangella halophila]